MSKGKRPAHLDLGDIVLDFSSRAESRSGTGDEMERIETWCVEIQSLTDGSDDGVAIGNIVVHVLDVMGGASAVLDGLDAASGDLLTIGTALFDTETDGWSEAMEAAVGPCVPAVLILDVMRLDPEFRGQGLGPILLGRAIQRMGRGCAFAALIPAPVEKCATEKARDTARAALARTWGELGFEHLDHNVWVLDLTTITLDENLARLVKSYGSN